jgi:hypothetical protein
MGGDRQGNRGSKDEDEDDGPRDPFNGFEVESKDPKSYLFATVVAYGVFLVIYLACSFSRMRRSRTQKEKPEPAARKKKKMESPRKKRRETQVAVPNDIELGYASPGPVIVVPAPVNSSGVDLRIRPDLSERKESGKGVKTSPHDKSGDSCVGQQIDNCAREQVQRDLDTSDKTEDKCGSPEEDLLIDLFSGSSQTEQVSPAASGTHYASLCSGQGTNFKEMAPQGVPTVITSHAEENKSHPDAGNEHPSSRKHKKSSDFTKQLAKNQNEMVIKSTISATIAMQSDIIEGHREEHLISAQTKGSKQEKEAAPSYTLSTSRVQTQRVQNPEGFSCLSLTCGCGGDAEDASSSPIIDVAAVAPFCLDTEQAQVQLEKGHQSTENIIVGCDLSNSSREDQHESSTPASIFDSFNELKKSYSNTSVEDSIYTYSSVDSGDLEESGAASADDGAAAEANGTATEQDHTKGAEISLRWTQYQAPDVRFQTTNSPPQFKLKPDENKAASTSLPFIEEEEDALMKLVATIIDPSGLLSCTDDVDFFNFGIVKRKAQRNDMFTKKIAPLIGALYRFEESDPLQATEASSESEADTINDFRENGSHDTASLSNNSNGQRRAPIREDMEAVPLGDGDISHVPYHCYEDPVKDDADLSAKSNDSRTDPTASAEEEHKHLEGKTRYPPWTRRFHSWVVPSSVITARRELLSVNDRFIIKAGHSLSVATPASLSLILNEKAISMENQSFNFKGGTILSSDIYRPLRRIAQIEAETRRFLRLAAPMTVGNIFETVLAIMTISFLSQALGVQEMVAYTMTMFILDLSLLFTHGILDALYTCIIHSVGAENHKLTGQYVQISAMFNAFFSLPSIIFLSLYMDKVVGSFGFSESVSYSALRFVQAQCFASLVGTIHKSFFALLDATGRVRFNVIIQILQGITTLFAAIVGVTFFDLASLWGLGIINLVMGIIFFAIHVKIARDQGWLDKYIKGMMRVWAFKVSSIYP